MLITESGLHNFMRGYIYSFIYDYYRGKITSRDDLTKILKKDRFISLYLDEDYIEYITRKAQEVKAS